MKKYSVHVLKKSAGFSGGMKDQLAKEVEQFLNEKVTEGFEVVSVSFTYYEAQELVAFITLCR